MVFTKQQTYSFSMLIFCGYNPLGKKKKFVSASFGQKQDKLGGNPKRYAVCVFLCVFLFVLVIKAMSYAEFFFYCIFRPLFFFCPLPGQIFHFFLLKTKNK
jgi:hypothetical protein